MIVRFNKTDVSTLCPRKRRLTHRSDREKYRRTHVFRTVGNHRGYAKFKLFNDIVNVQNCKRRGPIPVTRLATTFPSTVNHGVIKFSSLIPAIKWNEVRACRMAIPLPTANVSAKSHGVPNSIACIPVVPRRSETTKYVCPRCSRPWLWIPVRALPL